ncbi:hypothetical protein AHAS_Ahas07G0051700 [Arachis hypogaea]
MPRDHFECSELYLEDYNEEIGILRITLSICANLRDYYGYLLHTNASFSPLNPNFLNELKAEARRNASTPLSLPLSATAVTTSHCHHRYSKLLSLSSSSGGPFDASVAIVIGRSGCSFCRRPPLSP